MATKPDRTGQPGELSIGQENAISVLLLGGTHREAATAAGVTRPTVTEWANHDAAFQAALNQARAALWAAATDRLRAMVPKAVAALEAALEANPDPKIALDLLKLVGIGNLGPATIGPQSAAEIDDAVAEVAERRALVDLWRDDIAAPRRLG